MVAGIDDPEKPDHEVFKTDKDGRFTWRIPEGSLSYYFVAHKDGLAPAIWSRRLDANAREDRVERRLGKLEPFTGVLVDGSGRAVGGARVRIEIFAHSSASPRNPSGVRTISTSYSYVRRDIIDGTPLEGVFETITDQDGRFTLRASPPETWLELGVTSQGGGSMRVKAEKLDAERVALLVTEGGFVSANAGEPARLVAFPAARVAGRVVSTLSDVRAAGLRVSFQGSRPAREYRGNPNMGAQRVFTGEDGRFVIDGLNEGTINVFIHGKGEGEKWTYRRMLQVSWCSGRERTAGGRLSELIRGVEVEGTILAKGAKTPVVGANVAVYGPSRPRSGAMTQGAMTDDKGRFHYRLPPGETYFYVMGPPTGYTRLPGEESSRTVTITGDTTRFDVPPIELAAAVTVRGRVLDAAGSPVVGAKVVGTCEGNVCTPLPGTDTVTNQNGEFLLPEGGFNSVAIGKAARLLIRLADGAEHEAAVVPTADGSVTVKLPVVGDKGQGGRGPQNVGPGELAGMVVDTQGKPIEGVEVDAWTWYPGNETRTDAHGWFRLKRLDKDRKVEVVFRKPGYTPQRFMSQPTGAQDWVVALGNKTYFEGMVTSPAGKPVPDALIRADQGPKRADGVMITEIWTEARTDSDGRYRMYAQADVYDIQVRVPGVGAARLKDTALAADQAKRLDIALQPGVVFRAKLVDSLTAKPVAGVRLWHWQHKGVEGRSGEDGVVTVPDMLPGPFSFQVEAHDYARWWSDQSSTQWGRRQILPPRDGGAGWQRNFDGLDFDLSPGMDTVAITLEPAVKITGQVLDPAGNPVAGATVAPALTGTGNSLTGDTRFSFTTDAMGHYEMTLPASGDREYNLVAHDGKYGQWRTWANGVTRPFATKPGRNSRARWWTQLPAGIVVRGSRQTRPARPWRVERSAPVPLTGSRTVTTTRRSSRAGTARSSSTSSAPASSSSRSLRSGSTPARRPMVPARRSPSNRARPSPRWSCAPRVDKTEDSSHAAE